MIQLFKGVADGKIVSARGPQDKSYGWDPIFEPEGYDKTYAELGQETKDKISHRFRAVDAFRNHVLGLTNSSETGEAVAVNNS